MPDGDAVPSTVVSRPESTIPIKLLHDRVLMRGDGPDGERKSSGGILIPATAAVGTRLSWAEVVGVGPNVRSVAAGDRVMFDATGLSSVEIHGQEYVLGREREIHAVAGAQYGDSGTGLYL